MGDNSKEDELLNKIVEKNQSVFSYLYDTTQANDRLNKLTSYSQYDSDVRCLSTTPLRFAIAIINDYGQDFANSVATAILSNN